MFRIRTIAGIVALAAAPVLPISVQHAVAHGPDNHPSRSLTAQFEQADMIDVGASGDSLGDMQVASGSLLDSHGHTVGSFGFTCTWVGLGVGTVSESCVGWGLLPGGQVTVAGRSNQADSVHEWAITGGTGRFRDASGTATITDLSDTSSRIDLFMNHAS